MTSPTEPMSQTIRSLKSVAARPAGPKSKSPYQFTDPAVQRLMARADDGVIADVDELVALIRSVRDLFGADPTAADDDEAWLMATRRYEKSFQIPHRFLAEPTMRKLFGAILVDVLKGVRASG